MDSTDGRESGCRFPAVIGGARVVRFLAIDLMLMVAGSAQVGAVNEHIRLIQTADLHCHLEANTEGSGGVLRASTIVRDLRNQAPTPHVFHLDCGDTCQGTLMAVVRRGMTGIDVLKALKVDIWVPGNHELDFGTQRFAEFMECMKGRTLCANLKIELQGKRRSYPGWTVLQARQARLAVIGITARHLPYWFWGDEFRGIEPESGLAAVLRLRPEILASQPDMIILAAHQGWLENDPRKVNEIPEIVRAFPEIDLVLGGHTHRQHPGRQIGFHTWYLQPGQHGETVAVADVELDTKQHRVVSLISRLIPVTADTPEDPMMAADLAESRQELAELAEAPVGKLGQAISAKGLPGLDCAVSELICAAISAHSKARFVMHGRLSRAGLSEGSVTESDLFMIVPYENNIATAELTLDELERIVQEQIEQRSSYAFNGPWGFYATVQRRKGVRIEPPSGYQAGQRLTTAVNSYTVAGGGGRFPILRAILRRPECQLKDTGMRTRAVVREYLGNHPGLIVTPTRWLRFVPE